MNLSSRYTLFFYMMLFCSSYSFAQSSASKTVKTRFRVEVNEYTVVHDSSNKRIYYPDVLKRLASGDYTLDPIRDNKGHQTGEFRIRLKRSKDAGQRETELRTPGIEDWMRPKVGDTIPAFSLTAMDGSTVKSEYLKGKIVVISFWFTLCKPCLYEISDLNKLALSYLHNSDVVFLAPDWESRETLNKFMETHYMAYPPIPEAQLLIAGMKVIVYPTHLVIGRDGKILNSYSGGLPGIADILKKDIDTALGLSSH